MFMIVNLYSVLNGHGKDAFMAESGAVTVQN